MRCLATALHPNIQRFYLLACLLLESTTQLHVPLHHRRLLTQQVSVTQPRSINAIAYSSSPPSLISFILYLHPLPRQWPTHPAATMAIALAEADKYEVLEKIGNTHSPG